MNTEASGSFGALLRQYRERAGLTQEALAEQSGLTANAIGALERGQRRQPYPGTVRALATALQLESEQHEQLVQLARTRGRRAPSGPSADIQPIAGSSSAEKRLSLDALPVAPNRLIGREDEAREIRRALSNPPCRLVTVVGAGGVGKTRLALQVATDLAAILVDGVAFVALAPIAAPDHVPIAVASALHAPLKGMETPAEQIIEALRDRHMLLVVDNMEHVLQAADLLAMLLEHAPGVRLLVTSRERLRITGEWVINLQGLALPDRGKATATAPAPAIQLFEERARQVVHDFAVDPANEVAVSRICRLVEGMPLGIELATAWIGTLTPSEIADEIARNLDFLQRADRNAQPRHRSLRAVFDHSWGLLTPEEQQVFVRLAVFRGGFDRAAGAAVANASLPMLAGLVDKSLVSRAEDASGVPRYDLHELLRQYALATLQSDPDEEVLTRDHHCAYYARQLGERTNALLSGAMDAAWREIAPDFDNIRAGWSWAAQQRDHQALAQMGESIYVICESRGLFEEGVTLFREAAASLRATIAAPTIAGVSSQEIVWTLGQVLSLYGRCAAQFGRYGQARDLLREGYELLEQRGDILLRSGTLIGLGYTTWVLGRYAESRSWLSHCIALARAHGERYFSATSETVLALVAQAQGADDSLALAQSALDEWRALGQSRGVASGLWALSSVLLAQGKISEAAHAAREGLHLVAAAQDPWATARARLQVGAIALAQGNMAEAHALVEESVNVFAGLGEPWCYGRALVTRGWVALAQGDDQGARAWFQQALDLARRLQLDPVMLDAQFGLASQMRADAPAAALAFAEQVVAHPAADQATRARAIELRRALITAEYGGAGLASPDTTSMRATPADEMLTAREVEVLHLLARGRSNRAIASELVVVVGTVKRHVNSILGKLQAESRLEAVARARDLGLI